MSTKIHAGVNEYGLPVKIVFTAGHRNEILCAEELVHEDSEVVIADRAYDSNRFREHLEAQEKSGVIPPRVHRKAPIEFEKSVL